MTAWQLLAARLQSSGGEPGDSPPEPKDPWEEASASAKPARHVIEGVFRQKVPTSRIGFLTETMHWGYGIGVATTYRLLP